MFRLKDYFLLQDEATPPEAGGAGGSLMGGAPNEQTPPSNEDPEIIGKPPAKDPTEEKDKQAPTNNEDRPEWLPEEFKTVQEFTDKYKDNEKALNSLSGAPEKYEVSIPEGFNLIEGVENDIEGFKELAKKNNVSQEFFNDIIDYYFKSEESRAGNEFTQRETAATELFGGGDVAAERIATMQAKARTAFDAETYGLLVEAASGSPSAAGSAMRFAENVLNKYMGEPGQFSDKKRTPNASIKTREELTQMMKDPRYKTDESYRQEVSNGFKALHGEV